MNRVELNAVRNELARRILATDDMNVLNHVREVMNQIAYPEPESYHAMEVCEEPLHPYTMDELNRRIDAAEAEFDTNGGISSEEAHLQMQSFLDRL